MNDKITAREALLLILDADQYPCLGNEDWPVALALREEALQKAKSALICPDEPPQFYQWLETLLNPKTSWEARDETIMAMYDYFFPEE